MASRSKPSLATLRRRHERRTRRRAWLRRTFLAGAGILLALVLFPAVQRYGYAYQQTRRVQTRLTFLKQQHERLTQEVQERQQYRDYLRTTEAQEARARHDGYHRPGEQVYLLPPENP